MAKQKQATAIIAMGPIIPGRKLRRGTLEKEIVIHERNRRL